MTTEENKNAGVATDSALTSCSVCAPTERHIVKLGEDASKTIFDLWHSGDNFGGSMFGQPQYVGGGEYELKIAILTPEQTDLMIDFVRGLIGDDPSAPNDKMSFADKGE